MKFYLIVVYDDVTPEIKGAYTSEAARDRAAKRFRMEDPEGHNGLFPLDVPLSADPSRAFKPKVWAYSGAFFEGV